jgi:hypothetical protein
VVSQACRAYQRRLSAGGDLANESGEKDFDGSIREALRISLAQSPLLNLLSEKKQERFQGTGHNIKQ